MAVPDARTRYRSALFHPLNVLVVFGILVVVLATRSLLVLGALVACEALYLAVIPNLRAFAGHVERCEARRQADADRLEYDRLVGRLDEAGWKRHQEIKDLFRGVQDRLVRPAGSVVTTVAGQGIRRVDQLLHHHLRMLLTLQGVRQYRAQVAPDAIRAEIERAERDAAQESSEEVRRVKDSNTQVLRERLKRVEKTGDQEKLLAAGIQAIENAIRLIHDSVQTMGPADEVTGRIDEVLSEVTSNEQLLEELKPFVKAEDETTESSAAILRDAPERRRTR